MTKRHNGFRRGAGGVFACGICKRATRYTGAQSLGNDICPQCYEIAGLDNLVNDGGLTGEEAAPYIAECEGLLAEIAKAGGDTERVKRGNGFIWKKEVPT